MLNLVGWVAQKWAGSNNGSSSSTATSQETPSQKSVPVTPNRTPMPCASPPHLVHHCTLPCCQHKAATNADSAGLPLSKSQTLPPAFTHIVSPAKERASSAQCTFSTPARCSSKMAMESIALFADENCPAKNSNSVATSLLLDLEAQLGSHSLGGSSEFCLKKAARRVSKQHEAAVPPVNDVFPKYAPLQVEPTPSLPCETISRIEDFSAVDCLVEPLPVKVIHHYHDHVQPQAAIEHSGAETPTETKCLEQAASLLHRLRLTAPAVINRRMPQSHEQLLARSNAEIAALLTELLTLRDGSPTAALIADLLGEIACLRTTQNELGAELACGTAKRARLLEEQFGIAKTF
eukprot:gnl/Hemi2/7228_TR2458_c0_g1_i1.p1 gnl/Hemi2/7228_TR2458_c0_g1~~gnl/Hemi2/7228_TR2458_c0_g1_i1.p1  ORF type:complete len:349 (+),score=105.57 gnl/Hemi2/7228_TR2458_c0_g1_i1:234-1280(+)